MDMHELKLRYASRADRRNVLSLIDPLRKLPHEMRNVQWHGRSIADLVSPGINDTVLSLAVIARVRVFTTDAFDLFLQKRIGRLNKILPTEQILVGGAGIEPTTL